MMAVKLGNHHQVKARTRHASANRARRRSQRWQIMQ